MEDRIWDGFRIWYIRGTREVLLERDVTHAILSGNETNYYAPRPQSYLTKLYTVVEPTFSMNILLSTKSAKLVFVSSLIAFCQRWHQDCLPPAHGYFTL